MSYAEANQYLDVTYADRYNMKSRVAPTAYAEKQGAYTSYHYNTETADGDKSGWWWLRSPGIYQNYAAGVKYGDSLGFDYVNSVDACVRPALWVNIEAEVFNP